MNPGVKLLLAILIAFLASINASLTANLAVIIGGCLYLLFKKLTWRRWLLLIFLPLPAAAAIFSAIYWGKTHTSLQYALILTTRIYVFVIAGTCVGVHLSPTTLVRSLEQNFHLASKYAYGILAGLNLFPQMQRAVKVIRAAGDMRGEFLSWWSPRLYFKACVTAISAAENLTQGLQAAAFIEDQPRSVIASVSLTKKDWQEFSLILASFCLLLFTCP
jgi:energy-coupling factor transport system permease protein